MWPLCHSSVVGPNPAGGFTILRTSFVFHFAKILHFAFCQIVQSHFGLILKNVEFALCINAMDGHDQRTNLEVQMQRPFYNTWICTTRIAREAIRASTPASPSAPVQKKTGQTNMRLIYLPSGLEPPTLGKQGDSSYH